MLDFITVKNQTTSLTALADSLSKADLYRFSDEMIDTVSDIVADATDADVVFVPTDPNANDTFGIPEEQNISWTLGHVIVHATASSEESAALALTLARGIEVEGRSRYEVPWRSVESVAQIRQRLEESRRMRRAMLDAWPDEPHLDVTYTAYAQLGPLNAISRFIMGLYHEESHLEQLREIMRQARAARTQ